MPRTLLRRVRIIGAVAALVALLLALPQGGASAASVSRTNPSGAAIPAVPGWHLKFADNFTGGKINTAAWSVFGSTTGASPKLKSNVIVHNGMVTLRVAPHNGHWSGSGMCGCRVTTGRYGTYLLRVRYQHGLGAKAYALLWPTKGWPPEVDFMEYDARDATHHELVLTNHYSSANLMQHAFIPGNWSAWHTIGLRWTPNALTYTVDGKTTAVMTGHVPHVPMRVGIANSLGKTLSPNAAKSGHPVNLDIDWFAYYVQS